jgi:hypothetical protein
LAPDEKYLVHGRLLLFAVNIPYWLSGNSIEHTGIAVVLNARIGYTV